MAQLPAQHGPCVVLPRTTLENFRRISHLMVPLQSVGHISMFSTLPVAVGRLWPLFSTEAAPLHAYLVAHVLVLWLQLRENNF